MGCGKSAVANLVGSNICMPIIESDKIISELIGQTISEIFNTSDQEYFRSQELAVVNTLDVDKSYIISTGGGAVETPELMKILRQNGIAIWLDRPWDQIISEIGTDTTRPLVASLSSDELQDLFSRRCLLYKSAADYTINTGILSVAQVAEKVNEIWRECES